MAGLSATAVQPKVGLGRLAGLAAAAIAVWLAFENAGHRLTHREHGAMLRAARGAAAAAAVIREAKAARGLLQPAVLDPNATGLIGPEFTAITTSLGVIEAKRTTTNPDLAAAFVRVLVGLGAARGEAVVLVLSGSFPGANIAALAAADALGLHAAVVNSLGASMFGATDPQFSWLEMEAELTRRGVLVRQAALTLLGGGGGVARNMEEDGARALRASALRLGASLVEAPSTPALIEAVAERLRAMTAGRRIAALINVGGAVVALGTCRDADRLPVGLSHHELPCRDGTPGLIVRHARDGVPVIHVLNVRRLALDWGLPFDPHPLPGIGNNRRIYGD